jgi:hypothetical protein
VSAGFRPYARLAVGSSVEWYTPPELFDALGLSFDLDVCAPPGGLPWIPAKRSLSRADDGLSVQWHGRVWMNPPYGPGIERWMQKLATHGDGLAFVHARTGTAWWREAVSAATAVCFVADSVRFIRGATGNRPAGSSPMALVLLAYGFDCATAVMRSGLGPCLIVPPGTKPGTSLAQHAKCRSRRPGMAVRPVEGAPLFLPADPAIHQKEAA